MAATTINKPTLVALSGPLKGKKFPIKYEAVTLGSTSDSDITIPGDKVSRNHAVIELDEFGVWNAVAKSEIGILVNKSRSERSSLNIGDLIQIGELTLFKFEGKLEKTTSKLDGSTQIPKNTIKVKKPILYLLVAYLLLMLGVGIYLSVDINKETETGLSSEYLQKVLASTKEHLNASAIDQTGDSSRAIVDINRDTSAHFYNIKNSKNENVKQSYINSLMEEVENTFFRAWKFEKMGQYQKALDEYHAILNFIPDNNAATTKVANWRISSLKEKIKER